MKQLKRTKQITKKAVKGSAQKKGKPKKLATPARVLPLRPVYAAAAHIDNVQQHLQFLKLIQAAYSDSVLGSWDSELSLEKKKKALSKSLKQLGATLASWHCRALDLVEEGKKLKANFTDQHAELQKAIAHLSAPRIN